MIREQLDEHPLQSVVVFDAGILVSLIGSHFGGDLFGDDKADFVGILSLDIAELVVEGAQDIAQAVQFRLG